MIASDLRVAHPFYGAILRLLERRDELTRINAEPRQLLRHALQRWLRSLMQRAKPVDELLVVVRTGMIVWHLFASHVHGLPFGDQSFHFLIDFFKLPIRVTPSDARALIG